MNNDLYSQIKDELKNRSTWEDEQATWYQMRYDGIRRAKLPYPKAPDMHYKLIDTMIEKLKPFYISQIYSQEHLAAFSGSPQAQSLASDAEKLFDYVIKQDTNFERTLYTSIDQMLMYGRGPIKTRWDDKTKQIVFSAIRPIHVIVPSWTEDLCDADWLVHIMHLSVDQYKRNEAFNQDPGFINRIKGRGEQGMQEVQAQQVKRREGITCGSNDNQIVLWEVYSRDGDNILIDTISPIIGEAEQVRATVGLPYKHGMFPFVDLRYELQDLDYYSVRGLAEILSEDEQSLNKLWNHQLQFLDFFGQPNFESAQGVSIPANFQNKPGAILPAGLTVSRPESAPMDFKEQMELRRALAEDRVQIPDLSAGQHLAGPRGSSGKVTATQINALVSQSSGGNDLRSRTFKLQLATLYQQAWALMCQYLNAEQVLLEDSTEVSQAAMQPDYRITPSGSADSSSKEQRMSKALAYYQTLEMNPFVNVGELTKYLLEQDDSSLVKRLYNDPNEKQLSEGENQSIETMLMERGRQSLVKKSDDHKAHLQDIAGWMERKRQTGEPITPETAQLVLQHSQGHAQGIQQSKDKQGMMMLKQLQPYAQVLQQIVAQASQGIPGGSIPGPGEGPMPQGAAPQLPSGPAGAPQLPAPQQPGVPAPAQPQGGTAATIQLQTPAPVVDLSQVHIPAPVVTVKAPVVNVPAPVVKIAPQPPPIVNVPAPVVHIEQDSRPKKITVLRDKSGKITGAEVEPE